MTHVILQPAGSVASREHFINTVAHPVSFAVLYKFLGSDCCSFLNNFYPQKSVPVWGVVPGKKEINKKKWGKVRKGDVVFFCRSKKIEFSATVTYKEHNKELAERLWGTDERGATWEYIYFLDEVKGRNIPYAMLNKFAEYQPNYVVQGFSVLEEQKSTRILAGLDLASKAVFEDVTENDYFNATDELKDAPLDIRRTAQVRTEQAFLRNSLFGGKRNGICCICGKTYPVEFLVAAHIKKRAHCSDDEKRDWRNIVVPMCKFGCDDLYERGYIGVEDGKVCILQHDLPESDIERVLGDLDGNRCGEWSESTKKYFEWHVRVHRK